MKILITESRLYNAFKGWMDSELSFGLYEWKKDEDGDIWLVDTNEGYGHMLLVKKSRNLYVYEDLFTEINNFFPLEESDLLELIHRYVSETFQMEGINTYLNDFQELQRVGNNYKLTNYENTNN